MTSHIEAKVGALQTLTGSVGNVTDLEHQWLDSVISSPQGDRLREKWITFLGEQGYSGTYTERLTQYLTDEGYTGTLDEQLYQYWLNGGGGGGPTPPEPGATLAFHAATFDASTYEMQAQAVGTGTPTFTVDDGLLLPDSDGVYVAISEDTAPWHGARWDAGTAYADDSGGSPLTVTPSLYSAPALTNLQTYSNDQTNGVWTATNVTVARNADGLTGAPNTACTLTATANNGTVIAGALTSASDTHSARWFIQRGSGTGTVEITVDNGTTWQDVTSTVDGSDTWPECLEGLTLANPRIGIRLGTSGDSVIVGNAECIKVPEAEVKGSAPIITTGSTVSVAATTNDWAVANHSDTEGGYYMEVMPFGSVSDFCLSVRTAATARFIYPQSGNVRSSDGASFASVSGAVTLDVWSKVANAYGSSLLNVNLEGAWDLSPAAYDGSFDANSDLRFRAKNNTNANDSVTLVKNIRRYDGTYAESMAAIDELMS